MLLLVNISENRVPKYKKASMPARKNVAEGVVDEPNNQGRRALDDKDAAAAAAAVGGGSSSNNVDKGPLTERDHL
jgi:transcription initiation factor TFIID subunit TAF12